MSAKVHAGMSLKCRADGTLVVVKAVMRNGRFLVRFGSRSAWLSAHEKSAFEVVA